jgi:hypothetical protein
LVNLLRNGKGVLFGIQSQFNVEVEPWDERELANFLFVKELLRAHETNAGAIRIEISICIRLFLKMFERS